MDVKIEGKKITITAEVDPHTSKSGKSTVIFSTEGNKPTTASYDGKVVIAGINLYVVK